jgi:hypothetical protein
MWSWDEVSLLPRFLPSGKIADKGFDSSHEFALEQGRSCLDDAGVIIAGSGRYVMRLKLVVLVRCAKILSSDFSMS